MGGVFNQLLLILLSVTRLHTGQREAEESLLKAMRLGGLFNLLVTVGR